MKNLRLFAQTGNYFRNLSFSILPTILVFCFILAANSNIFSQITVDRTDDTATATACTAAANDCSLRGAFAYADSNSGTTITVPAGTYNLTLDELRVGDVDNLLTNINGAGANLVTINQTASRKRIINLNPTLEPNVVVNISGIRFTGGNSPIDMVNGEPQNLGGGAIIGGGAGNALNLSNCIFDNNSDSLSMTAKGGAVEWAGGGFLSINNCIFDNNTAGSSVTNRGVGGAVDYNLLNLAGNAGQGGLSITNSTFTNNKAGAENSGAGGAVSVTVTTTQMSGNVSITNNTFVGNQANALNNGLGGAIVSTSSKPITVKFNRIAGNTATGGATGIYQGNGTIGTIDATQNWWGCNLGPGNAGCNSIGGETDQITTNPRIVLTLTAGTNPIVTGQQTVVTASFLRDSANNVLTLANISRLIGLPISFTAVRGNLSGAQTAIQANGAATVTFRASSAGAGSVTGVVDSSNDATRSITIDKAFTTISIISDSPDPTVTGETYTVNFGSVQVTAPGSSSPTAPTGTITVSDGTSTCTVNVPATSCQFQSFTVGVKNLTVRYNGDANFNASPSSSPITHTVNKADTTVALSAPSPTVFGQSYEVTAGAFPVFPGGGSPTGTISVTDGTNNCTITLPAFSCFLPSNYIGTRGITATYNGDANYNASPPSDPIFHTVEPANTITTIISDAPDPSRVGQDVTITFTVVAQSPGAGTPTGNVTVSDGTNSCTASVAIGQCILNFSAVGNYSLNASYEGSTTFNASVSVAEPHTVCQAGNVQVTNNADSGAGSLRQTIVGGCPGNVITFAPGVTGTINIGSAIDIDKDVEIQGTGAKNLFFAGNSANGVFNISSGTIVKISGVTISNSALRNGNGGAIANGGNLTLTSVVVRNSSANNGGGIYNDGVLTIDRSAIWGNTAFANGGGIESTGNASSRLTIVNSTISGNNAFGFGGGMDVPTGTLTLINATVTGNRAETDNNGIGAGGGIYTNSSVAAPATLRNNIIANNFIRPVGNSPAANDLGGNNITNAFYNIIGNAATAGGIAHGVNGNQVGNSGFGTIPINAVLETALTDNGGDTPTHKLVSGGLAVDKGSAATSPFGENILPPITTDQRDVIRPYDISSVPNASGGDGSDIGAYELIEPTAANVSVSGRVLTADGRGLRNAVVTITDSLGNVRSYKTTAFGYYRFDEIQTGETYILRVSSKQFTFYPQIVSVNDEITELNLIAVE